MLQSPKEVRFVLLDPQMLRDTILTDTLRTFKILDSAFEELFEKDPDGAVERLLDLGVFHLRVGRIDVTHFFGPILEFYGPEGEEVSKITLTVPWNSVRAILTAEPGMRPGKVGFGG